MKLRIVGASVAGGYLRTNFVRYAISWHLLYEGKGRYVLYNAVINR